MTKALLFLKPAALERLRVLSQENPECLGLRLSVKTKGCSGLSYELDLMREKNPLDESVTQDGVTLFVDPKAVLFVLGMDVDYVDTQMHSGFVFENPNEKGRCGCGKSFHV